MPAMTGQDAEVPKTPGTVTKNVSSKNFPIFNFFQIFPEFYVLKIYDTTWENLNNHQIFEKKKYCFFLTSAWNWNHVVDNPIMVGNSRQIGIPTTCPAVICFWGHLNVIILIYRSIVRFLNFWSIIFCQNEISKKIGHNYSKRSLRTIRRILTFRSYLVGISGIEIIINEIFLVFGHWKKIAKTTAWDVIPLFLTNSKRLKGNSKISDNLHYFITYFNKSGATYCCHIWTGRGKLWLKKSIVVATGSVIPTCKKLQKCELFSEKPRSFQQKKQLFWWVFSLTLLQQKNC